MTPWYTYSLGLAILFFVTGVCLGSFGNVVIIRVPYRRTLWGRSQCMDCKRILKIAELVPLMSFLALRGKCRGCSSKISWQYPFVELSCGLLFLYAIWHTEYHVLPAAILSVALWLLFLIAYIDGFTSGIPDALNIPLVIVGAVFSLVTGNFSITGPLLGCGFFAAQWILSRGRWVGSGDIILGAGIGSLLGGWRLMLAALFFSYVSGALIASIFLISEKKGLQDSLSFGPFLALGTFLTLTMGPTVMEIFPL